MVSRGQYNASGGVIDINSYDEFGIPASGNTGRFGYTGQIWLPEAGMWYYKARMYSPTLGRFMQTDPIGYADGMNVYAYVGNDPVNKVDPNDMQAQSNCSRTNCDQGPPPLEGPIVVTGTRNDRWEDAFAAARIDSLLSFQPSVSTQAPQNTLPCSAANQSKRGLRVVMGFTDTPVPGTSHAFILVTDPATGAQYASRAGPGSGPGGGSSLHITAVSGAYGEGFPDYGAVTGAMTVGYLNVSFGQAANYMNAFRDVTNGKKLIYGGLIQNSNSYAAAMLKGMGFKPPSTGRVTPGYNSNPVDPSIACH